MYGVNSNRLFLKDKKNSFDTKISKVVFLSGKQLFLFD
ncbi:hypothetical protein CTK_C06650 [Clostridium tyrobutyricum]|nr:hypothetical protein CTK_C06650 [Clostridium tyrobutyricum]